MKNLLYLLILNFLFFNCTNKKTVSGETDSIESVATVTEETSEKTEEVSYARLKIMLDKNEAIPVNYLVSNVELPPQKALYDHRILRESESYVIIQSGDDGTAIKNYYLLSFSKKTGKLISFIGLGQEAEGVNPYKVIWHSNNSFSTVDYQYELVEDEESGAYMQGALQDSTVLNYSVNREGVIIEKAL